MNPSCALPVGQMRETSGGLFQHWVMRCGSSQEADTIGSVIGRGDRKWTTLLGWMSRWKRRISAF